MNERACLGTLDRFYQGFEMVVTPEEYISRDGAGAAVLFPEGAPKAIDTLFLETLWNTPGQDGVLPPFLMKTKVCLAWWPWYWGVTDQASSEVAPASTQRGTVRAIQIGVCDAEGNHRSIAILPENSEALYFNDRGVLRILAGHFTGEPVLNNHEAPSFLRALWEGQGQDRPVFINQTPEGMLQAGYRDGRLVEIQTPNAADHGAHRRVA
jgi:hypothetical protein